MYWLALWVASATFNLNLTTGAIAFTLETDSNTYESVASTSEYVSRVIGSSGTLGDVEDTTYRAFRAKPQGVTFNTNGTVKLSLRAGTPTEYIIAWNRNGYVQPVTSALSNMEPSVHYSIAGSSTALVNYIQARHALTGEVCKVYLASQELKLYPELNIWVR